MAYRKSLDFLPSIFQTKTNERLLRATIDQLVSEPELKQLNGFIGRKFNPALTPGDSYIQEDFADRQNYQLEPSAIYTDSDGNIKFVSSYVDLLNRIDNLGGIVNDPSRLFSADQYSYSGLFDFDKFVNYSSYYWLPNGPDSVNVVATKIPLDQDIAVNIPTIYSVVDGNFDSERFDAQAFDVSNNSISRLSETGYTFSTTGKQINPTVRLARGGSYRFNVNQIGHGFFIQTQPGTTVSYPWQRNLNIREVFGVNGNGNDVGTVTFNVPAKNAQDFFLNMKTAGNVNLVAYSFLQNRLLRYTEVQNANLLEFLQKHVGIDGQRSIIGKTILFLQGRSENLVPVPWTAKTNYLEGDLIIYANIVYRALRNFTSGRIFTASNLEIYDLEDHWFDPALFDDSEVGFDGANFDRGADVPLENRLGWFTVNVNSEGIINLTPAGIVPTNKKVSITEGIETGNREIYRTANNQLELVPPITANLDILYYQDAIDPNLVGIIELVDQDNNLQIDVNNILQRKNYTSPNGVVFENGLKIRFSGNVSPAEYENNTYYVEGVGESIELVNVTDLETPEPWLETVGIPFDIDLFDSQAFDESQPAPIQKQYITIKRNSIEGSAWTRQNRWFHENVIKNTNQYNNFTTVIDQESRAKRPIIEFDANIQLFNFGKKYKTSVTVFDTLELDALSNVKGTPVEITGDGVSSYFSDGIPLINGNRVVFANDESEEVRKTIWQVDWIIPESQTSSRTASFVGDGATVSFNLNFEVTAPTRLAVFVNGVLAQDIGLLWSLSGQNIVFSAAPADNANITINYVFGKQIHLSAVDSVKEGDVVLSTLGRTGQGVSWYYNGDRWIETQGKTSNNQAPLFELYDHNNVSVLNETVYPSSNFSGNKIFSYKIGNTSKDSELGLRLAFRSIGNVGDILFVDHITSDNFSYEGVNENTVVKSTAGLNVAKNRINGTRVFTNQWTRLKNKSKQYQVETFFATQYQKNNFKLNITPRALDPENILVYKNNVALTQNDFDVEIVSGVGFLLLTDELLNGDKIDVKIFNAEFNNQSVWEIPSNLENNAKNHDVREITLGQMRKHILDAFVNTPGFEGNYQGLNNSKDLPNVKLNGGKILQNAGAPQLANLFLNDAKANFVESLIYAQREYATFKNKFLRLASELPLRLDDPVGSVDTILDEIFANKNEMFPFYRSDMVPAGNDFTTLSYTVVNSSIDTYFLSSRFDSNSASNRAVVVYLNGVQLIKDLDYTFSDTQPIIRFNIAPVQAERDRTYLTLRDGDVITIREYNNTDGFHVPPTPTKLGLYPSYRPRIVKDGYNGNIVDVIRGHDGSLTVAYGDYRDNIILELEKRIYNNIKSKYTGELFDILGNIPGAFRSLDYNKEEFDFILSTNFSTWLGTTNLQIDDFYQFDSNNSFTWNYSNFADRIFNLPMPAGNWRGLYKFFYDTDAPQLRPWEMLGFTEQPEWWATEYGPAPYTSGNKVLWDDLEQGIIRRGDREGVDARFVRPGLSNIIPVDDSGILLSPFECLALNTTDRTSVNWKFGDTGPVENAWRQSSEYPFAVQLAMALTKPAEYFGLFRNTIKQVKRVYDTAENYQWSFDGTGLRNVIEYVHGETVDGEVIRSSGYTTWIAEYATSLSLDITESVGKKLRELDLRLSYKVGGYTDKKYIKLFADQSSPESVNSSVLIPDEDYQIKLVKSSPILSLTYSGVIVTRSGTGFSVRGYDQNKPFFIAETGKTTGETLIIKSGSDTVEVAKEGSGRFITIPYGTELLDKSEVVDFLVGLGRYQERQGFRFTRKVENSTGDLYNWTLAAKEFLFWTQQGWDNDIAITLSPIGNEIEFRSARGAVDAISNRPYGSRILSNNFEIIDSKNYIVDRNGRNFSLTVNDNRGIYLADIDVVDYEHVIVLNNVTRFNDIIYQPDLGNRQFRIKITGFKTGDWDGTFGAAGFIINDNNIQQWQLGKNYYKGEIVFFKNRYYVATENISGSTQFDFGKWVETEYKQINSTLLPNLSNKAGQPKSFYDFNQTNLELDADRLGKGLIGFSPRSYLNDLGISDTSQVKFYQGLIRQKGSNNSFNKMLRAKLDNFDGSVEFFEQWAIRDGAYGATENTRQLRLPIASSQKTSKNPLVIEFLDANDDTTAGRLSLRSSDLLTYSRPYNKNFFSYRNRKNQANDLPGAGFVKINEVNYTSPNLDRIGEFLDNNVTDGSRVWVSKDNLGSWNVYRFTDVNLMIDTVSIDGSGVATVVTKNSHGLQPLQRVYIKSFGNSGFDGYYQIQKIVNNNTFKIRTSFSIAKTTNLLARIYVLVELRQKDITNIPAITPLNGWKNSDQFYLDDATSSGWGVYEKVSRYNVVNRYSDTEGLQNDNLGVSVASARNNNYLLAGSSSRNKVQTYLRQPDGSIAEDVEITDPSEDLVDFGAVISVSSNGYAAVGSPSSTSNIGFVHILRRDTNGRFIVDQAIAPFSLDVNGQFGSAIAISDDARWLYVGQPDKDEGYVWVYQLIEADSTINQKFFGDGSTASFVLTGTASDAATNIYSLKIADRRGKILIPFRDYTFDVSTKTITFTVVPDLGEINVFFRNYYNLVLAATLSDSAGDRFAASLATSTDGSQVIIGVPKANDDSTIVTDSGKVYIIDRTSESQYANGVSRVFTTGLPVNGNPLVKINDNVQTLNGDYTFNGVDTVTFIRAPAAGSIVTIDTNNPVLSQILKSFETVQAGAQFGFSLDLCPTNCSLYVGAPFEDDNTVDGGKVHRFINQGRFFGTAKGTVINPTVSTASVISLNNFLVSFAGGEDLSEIARLINQQNIPGVTALTENQVLTIETDREIFADKLNIVELFGNFLADVGIEIYVSQQIISSPIDKNFNNFGKVVRVSTDALTLAIGTDVGDTILRTTFDNGTTTLDRTTTQIFSRKQQSGSVLVYELIVRPNSTVENPSQFIFAEKLTANDIDELDRFGSSIDVSNNTIYVGAPGNDHAGKINSGLVYGFVNTTGKKTWSLIRSETPKIDLDLINNAYIYNNISGEKIVDLDIVDPAKGRVSGTAQQEITYQTTLDPAFYNDQTNTGKGIIWGQDHVGEIWWNTNLAQWIEYEQDSVEYRAANWGFSFPGSRIICVEWTESDVPPENYSDPGNPDAYPLSTTRFNVFSEYNEKTERFISKYYFWVAGKTKAPKNVPNRTLSATQIEEIISNPRLNGVPYIAFFNQNNIGLYNVENLLTSDSVLVIDYDVKKNDNLIHSEYELVAEGDDRSIPSENTLTKLIDSLAGQDVSGNLVPDIFLNDFEKLGTSYRPRQSMFVDRRQSVREAVAYVNNFLKNIPAVYSKNISGVTEREPFPDLTTVNELVDNRVELDYLNIAILPDNYLVLVRRDETTRNRWVIYKKTSGSWQKHRIQSYNNNRYIDRINWTDSTVDVPEIVENVVDFEFGLQSIVASEGEFVKIKDNGLGLFKVVLRENNRWRTVQEENGTIQISNNIWKTENNLQGWDLDGFDIQLFDDWPSTEIQKIFRSVYNDIFVDEHAVEKNLWFVHMIKYALSEVKYSDWAFKTSLIKINQQQRALQQIPVFQRDNQDLIRQYIEEVKPYHTKISEFVLQYNGEDHASLNTTDFDLPAYYNFATNSYRSPTGATVEDEIILQLEPYIDWANNYTLELDNIDIYYSGSGYLTPPNLLIIGGGGSGATARAVVANGRIIRVEVTNPGSGYIATPTIVVDQFSQDPAILTARMANRKVRSFDTTIKFDRVSTISGWLVEFKDINGNSIDVRNQRISRIRGNQGIIDEVLNLFSMNRWLIDNEIEDTYPVKDVPNYRTFNDTSGRVQFFDKRDTRGWIPELLQQSIRNLGATVGVDNLDLRGTTVTIDGSLASFAPSVLAWTPGLTYYTNEIIVEDFKLYRVTQPFVATDRFDTAFLEDYSAADLGSHIDRTWAFYQPKDGMPGRDLAQLFDNVVFPGVNVIGANFNQNPGFDVSLFDSVGFDNSIIGPEGVLVIDPSVLDQTLRSSFIDTELGTRPEDLITAGGSFVDEYHSHAPEEIVPGRVYDSLSFTVHTLSTTPVQANEGYSPQIDSFTFKGNGVDNVFKINIKNLKDYFLVYTKNTGPRYRSELFDHDSDDSGYFSIAKQNSYTIDWQNSNIVFLSPIDDGDIVNIINIGQVGQDIIAEEVFIADGQTQDFVINVDINSVGNSLVLVNGLEVSNYSIVKNSNNQTQYILSSTPAAGSRVHIIASTSLIRNTISKINTQLVKINDNVNTIEIDEILRRDRSKDTTIIVELNGIRLRPGNSVYYTGDDSTNAFELPTSADEDYTSITLGDIRVWKNRVRLTPSDYELIDLNPTPIVVFNTVPNTGDEISITYVRNADYFVNEQQNRLRLSDRLTINNDSLLAITSFSDHDVYKFKTNVFVGTDQFSGKTIVSPGFDNTGFDNTAFDGDQTLETFDIEYNIDADQNVVEKVFVSINGVKLIPNIDYGISNGKIKISNAFQITNDTVAIITWMSPNIYTRATTFRIFTDMNGKVLYNRVAAEQSTLLAKDFKILDSEIHVTDGSSLSTPNPELGLPGVIFIDGERITYYQKEGNILKQLRRGTSGTGAVLVHLAGRIVVDSSERTKIPGTDDQTWYNVDEFNNLPADGNGLHSANTIQARFLKELKGIIPFKGFVQIGGYLLPGYVVDGYVE